MTRETSILAFRRRNSGSCLPLRLLSCLCATGLLLTAAGTRPARSPDWAAEFANPPRQYDMGVYWWWFGPAVTKPEVTRELEVMHKAHIGSVLIFPIYPIAKDDAAKGIRNLRYLSPEFLDVLGHACAEAKRLGMDVEVLMGTGWPFGGPSITPEHSAQGLRVTMQPLSAGAAVTPPALKPDEKLEAAYIVKGDGKTVDLAAMLDVTGQVRAGMRIDTRAADSVPRVLMTITWGPSGAKLNVPSLGADGLMLDHLSHKALDIYIKAVGEKLVAAAPKGALQAIHSDSMEVYGAEWTGTLPAEFARRRGYDLRGYLPALVADAGPLSADVRYDFWRTVSEMALDNYVRPLQQWCHSRGVKLQAESYGSPPVDMSSFSAVDQVMGESLDWKAFVASRWASSAAHQYGKRVTSAEAYTWLRYPRYVSTLQDIKLGSDLHFACGVNKLVGHGYAYSPPQAGIPGWGYYASVMFNDNNPWWPYFPLLSDYVRRTSYALTLGKPAVDVGLYLPEDDVMAAQAGNRALNLYWTLKEHLTGKPAREFSLPAAFTSEAPVIKTLITSGFTFDGFDHSILQPGLKTSRGRLEVGDVAYRIAILPDIQGISLPIFERLADFCRSGGTLIALRRLPEAAYGVRNREANYARVKALAAELFGDGAPGAVRRHTYGRGLAIYVPDETERLGAVLASLRPEIRFERPDADLVFVHRQEGARNLYFLANTSSLEKKLRPIFRDGNGAPRLWNAMDGSVDRTAPYVKRPGGTEIALTLDPYGSTLIDFDGRERAQPRRPGRKVKAPDRSISLAGPWLLRFPGNHETMRLLPLKSWTEFAERRFYSGRGDYDIDVNIPGDMLGGAKGIWLDLGEVREIADVSVNGRPAGVLWKMPYRLDITRWVRPGKNTLRIGVTNLLINRVLAEPDPDFAQIKQLKKMGLPRPSEKRLVPEPLPSGLIGPVRLTGYSVAIVHSEE